MQITDEQAHIIGQEIGKTLTDVLKPTVKLVDYALKDFERLKNPDYVYEQDFGMGETHAYINFWIKSEKYIYNKDISIQ